MKILFVTQLLPYPYRSGGRVKTYKTLQVLSKLGHQVQLVCFNDQKNGLKQAKQLEMLIPRLKVMSFYRPEVTADHKHIKQLAFRSLWSKRPFWVYKYFDQRMADYIQKVTTSERFKVLYLDHDTSFQYLHFVNRRDNAKVIYDEHNVSSVLMWRSMFISKWRIWKTAIPLYEAIKYRWWERKILRAVDRVVCISETDRIRLEKQGAEANKLWVMPIPFEITPTPLSRTKTIGFLGLLSWSPNIDGLRWFILHVYPEIKQRIPQVRLVVAGGRIDMKLAQLLARDRSITILGEIEDVATFYSKVGVVIVPILHGGGIRIKMLEAMSYGKPVVATTVGAEGIRPGVTKECFADACVEMLNNEASSEMGINDGIKLIQKRYSWLSALRVMERILA